jgi:DNA-binding LacI/PurR family transcriptional regulator
VSIVLNDPQTSRITAATKQRVLDAAAHLGYAPNAAASQLRAGASKTILIPLTSVPFDPVSEAFVSGVIEGADLHGRQVLIHGSRSSMGVAAARAWARLRPEVLIATADSLPKEGVEILLTAGVSAVVRLGATDAWGAHGVDYRPAYVARLTAERLFELGADDLAVVTRAHRHPSLQQDLVDAFRDAVSPRPVRVVSSTPDGAALGEWMRSRSRRDGRLGVFALDDRLADGIRLVAMETEGASQVALVAFGARPSPAEHTASYSRVGFDPATLGRQVVAAAVDIVAGRGVTMPRPDYLVFPGTELEPALDAAAIASHAVAPETVDESRVARPRHPRKAGTRPARRASTAERSAQAEAVATMEGATGRPARSESFDSVAERVQQRRKGRHVPRSEDEQA